MNSSRLNSDANSLSAHCVGRNVSRDYGSGTFTVLSVSVGRSTSKDRSSRPERTGVYMGIFNMMITLPMLLFALTLPLIYGGEPVEVFGSQDSYSRRRATR
jgi:hypothetical protein